MTNKFEEFYKKIKENKKIRLMNSSFIPNYEIRFSEPFGRTRREISIRRFEENNYQLTIYNSFNKKFIMKNRKYKTLKGIEKAIINNL